MHLFCPFQAPVESQQSSSHATQEVTSVFFCVFRLIAMNPVYFGWNLHPWGSDSLLHRFWFPRGLVRVPCIVLSDGDPVGLCCRLTAVDRGVAASCPVVFLPLTSSTVCRPQIVNYLLSEPRSASLRARQESRCIGGSRLNSIPAHRGVRPPG